MNLRRLENEKIEQYIWRLGTAKDAGIIDKSWDELADVINKEIGNENMPYTSSAYRKPYQQAKKFYDAGVFDNDKRPLTPSVQDVKSAYKAQTTINKDGSFSSDKLVEMNEQQAKDPDYILKAHGFDPDEWTLVSLIAP